MKEAGKGIKQKNESAGSEGSRDRAGVPRKRLRILAAVCIAAAVAAVLGVSAVTALQMKKDIAGSLSHRADTFTQEELREFRSIQPQCILVLGAAVYADGTPCPMLKDRLDTGIALYKAKAAPKLLFSGDNGQVEYNEVEAMLSYAVDRGIPKKDIFLDHAGFSTYESVFRAKEVFQVNRMIVVTQTYHLFRALYGCGRMDIEALGAGSDQEAYAGKESRELREVLARDKDVVKWMFQPNPKYLGDPIPINGDGRQTQEP